MTDDVFEDHLFRLENLLVQLASDDKSHTPAVPSERDEPGESGATAARFDDAATPTEEALELCMSLIAAWEFRQRGATVPAARDLLNRVGRIDRPGGAPHAADVVANIPWLLRTALHTLLDDDAVDANPRGRSAITARMLAAIVGSLEGVDGMRQHADAATATPWSAEVVPIVTGPRH